MIETAKFKGLYGATWYYGGVLNDGVDTFIIDKDGVRHKVYYLFEHIGADAYEDDLVAVIHPKTSGWFDGILDTRDIKRLLLFRLMRGGYGFYAQILRGDSENMHYDMGWILKDGKVVGNYYDCEDIDELYEKLEKEMIEND